MPVNMDPNKRRRPGRSEEADTSQEDTRARSAEGQPEAFGQETEEDREKDAADAEWKNLWDATEVIDMDKF